MRQQAVRESPVMQPPSQDIRVFSGAAPQKALLDLTPEFERATGHRLAFTFRLVSEIQQKLAAGGKADLVLLPVPLIAATEKTLSFRPEGRTVFARVGIGVIVPCSAAPPDISTVEAVTKLISNARAIALDDPSTPNGIHLDRMLEDLGIADKVRPKLIAKAPIQGGAELVAKGDADVGLYLLSEVQNAERGGTGGVKSTPVICLLSIPRDARFPCRKKLKFPGRRTILRGRGSFTTCLALYASNFLEPGIMS